MSKTAGSLKSPAPGGGSVSAYVGALGIALGTMVANLSAHKRGWDDKWEIYSSIAEEGQEIINKLLYLVDEDARAFDAIIQAMRLPKSTEQDIENRNKEIELATKNAIEIPFKVLRLSYRSIDVLKQMAEIGQESSISDVGVGIACARTAIMGAYLNVKINCKDLSDRKFAKKILTESSALKEEALTMESRILNIIEDKMDGNSKK